MPDLRQRFAQLDQIEVPEVWRQIEALGPRPPHEDRPSTVTRVVVAVFALLVAGAGIALAVRSLGRPSSPSSSPSPPADAILFAQAASDSLDARIEIAYVPASGGAVVALTRAAEEGKIAAEPRWSPDGSRIAFVMSPRGHLTRYAGDGDIYVMNADGADVRQLTEGLDAAAPAWSPDGSQLAFVKNQGQELVVMRADGSNQRVVARDRGFYQGPAWSPDGRAIAYQSSPGKDKEIAAIFTIRPDGTGERQLTEGSASIGSPAWSPDGSQIAYVWGSSLWIMNSDGGNAHHVTVCVLPCVADLAPSWSPRGTDLVFVRQEERGSASRLYVLDLGTATARPLTPQIRWAGSPDWRPTPR